MARVVSQPGRRLNGGGMNGTTQFLVEHRTPVLFGVVLLEQAGLPLPAIPWLGGKRDYELNQ